MFIHLAFPTQTAVLVTTYEFTKSNQERRVAQLDMSFKTESGRFGYDSFKTSARVSECQNYIKSGRYGKSCCLTGKRAKRSDFGPDVVRCCDYECETSVSPVAGAFMLHYLMKEKNEDS